MFRYLFQHKNESNATTLLNVHFKLAEVTTTVQGNVKENDPKFFRLHEQEAELDQKNKSFTIFFEYRQLGDVEKKVFLKIVTTGLFSRMAPNTIYLQL